jgi:hypothetical protein
MTMRGVGATPAWDGDEVAALATPVTDAGDLDVLIDRVGANGSPPMIALRIAAVSRSLVDGSTWLVTVRRTTPWPTTCG